MEFLGVLKKKNMEILAVNKKGGISRGVQEKLMWNFHGSWFLTLEFPRGVTQTCKISSGKISFSLEFPWIK